MRTVGKTERRLFKRKHKRLLFYSLMLLIPVANFLVFYVYQNFSVIIMAFEKYEAVTGGVGYRSQFAGFENFAAVFRRLNDGNWYMVLNSLWLFLFKTGLGMFLAVVFSYYICKKRRLAGFFRVMLFLPSVISSVILVAIYKHVVSDIYTALTGAKFGLLTTHGQGCVIFFNIWASFGTNVLIFSSTMSGIDDSVIEASKIDGANIVQEFLHVTVPMIFPTLVTFFVVGIANIFTDQAHLYTFFREDAQGFENIGYFLYVQALRSDVVAVGIESKKSIYLSYPEISAFGLVITAVIVPLTVAVRKLSAKFGPSAE